MIITTDTTEIVVVTEESPASIIKVVTPGPQGPSWPSEGVKAASEAAQQAAEAAKVLAQAAAVTAISQADSSIAQATAASNSAALASEAALAAAQDRATSHTNMVQTTADRNQTGLDVIAASQAQGYAFNAAASADIAVSNAGSAQTSATQAAASLALADTKAGEAANSAESAYYSNIDAAQYSGQAFSYRNTASTHAASALSYKNTAVTASDTAIAKAAIATAQAVIATDKATLTAADRVQTGLDAASAASSVATAQTLYADFTAVSSAASTATTAAGTANTKATEAANAAVSANSAAVSAGNSATLASDKAAAASADKAQTALDVIASAGSATTASNAAAIAGPAATNAAASAGIASTKAAEAVISASIATTKASEASDSAISAGLSKDSALASKISAEASAITTSEQTVIATSAANSAQAWAITPVDTLVSDVGYSALHWAAKSAESQGIAGSFATSANDAKVAAQAAVVAAGNASRLTAGTVTVGAAAVTITGEPGAQVLNLTIPPGATGATGATGPAGSAGADGHTGPAGPAGDPADIPASTHAAAAKTTPVDADEIPIVDSAASWGLKRLTWANLKATLATYFDGIYLKLTGGTLTGKLLANTLAAGHPAYAFSQSSYAGWGWDASGSNRGYAAMWAGTNILGINGVGVGIASNLTLQWSSSADGLGSAELCIYRDAADTLAQRRGTNAQTFRVYGTYTDPSNNRRLESSMSTAGVAVIKPTGIGSGASGNVLHISGLPTSNPGPGILWDNAGSVAIGT